MKYSVELIISVPVEAEDKDDAVRKAKDLLKYAPFPYQHIEAWPYEVEDISGEPLSSMSKSTSGIASKIAGLTSSFFILFRSTLGRLEYFRFVV